MLSDDRCTHITCSECRRLKMKCDRQGKISNILASLLAVTILQFRAQTVSAETGFSFAVQLQVGAQHLGIHTALPHEYATN